jgi:integrase
MANSSAQKNRGSWKKDEADKGLLLRGHIYSIRFTDQFGTMRTESVGPSKAFARKVLENRRTEVLEKRYFPERAARSVTFKQIIDAACEATKRAHALKYHGARRFRDYRYGIISDWFADRAAASITPEEIESKLHEHCKTSATRNQYRLALSKAYKIALANKKVFENSASAVKLQRLNNGRERYLNQFPPRDTEDASLKQCTDEESRLRNVIRKRFAEREAEFDLALHTGMRFSEQYNLTWADVDFERKIATIQIAKSGKREHVILNSSLIAALVKLRARLSADKEVGS